MIYLDSAIATEAAQAMTWGWVKGITTNPTLLAKSETVPDVTLKTLAEICHGELYYQLMSHNLDDMIREAHLARNLIGEKLVLKIPATFTGFAALGKLAPEMCCSVTAIYHPTQALIAAEGEAIVTKKGLNRPSIEQIF